MDNTRDDLLDLIRNATNIDMICFFAIIYVVAPDSPPYTPIATRGELKKELSSCGAPSIARIAPLKCLKALKRRFSTSAVIGFTDERMVYMLQIGMIVKILPDAEYSGKFTGYIGKVKNYFSQNKKVGVELFQQTNDASSKGLFWFSESKVVAAGSLPDAMMEYIKADLNAAFGVANHTRRSRQTGLPQIKKVIYSGPKTIILWADNTKTIVSCGEADSYDYYSGFCAAVVKKLFGSTTHAKKVLGDSIQIND